MQIRGLTLCEYESGYDSVYGGIYDQNFVFYDDEEVEEDSWYDSDDESDYEEDDSGFEDVILEEIPFVYCPNKGETGEA